MRKSSYVFIVLLIVIVGATARFCLSAPNKQVLSLVSPVVASSEFVATSSATITASPSATPKPISEPNFTPKPTPKPTAAASHDVNGFIDRFSAQYGVDPNVVRRVALCESGFNSNATNNVYVGLFQFDSRTWINIRKEMGENIDPDLRFSAEESVQTAAYSFSKGKGGLWPNCFPH